MAIQRGLWDAPTPEPEPEFVPIVAVPLPAKLMPAAAPIVNDRPYTPLTDVQMNHLADAILTRQAWAQRRLKQKEELKYKRRNHFKKNGDTDVEIQTD
jgi:hypothetical protein